MGKNRSANAPRGSQPASSSRALESMQGWSPSAIGFGTFVGTSSVASADNPDLPPDLQVIVRKLLKKDSVTKLKAFSDLNKAFVDQVLPNIESFLTSWVVLYPKLSQDISRQVRETTGQFFALLLKNINKKMLAPHLKALVSSWLCSICDPSKETRLVSLQAFQETFQPAKRGEAILFCRNEIANNLLEVLSTAPKRKDADPEDEENQERILSSTFSSLSFILETLSEDELSKMIPSLESLFDSASFWGIPKSPFSTFRKAFYDLLASLCQKAPEYAKDKMKELTTASLASLHDPNPVNLPSAYSAFVALFTTFPDCWKGIDISKRVLPPITQQLAAAFGGVSYSAYSILLPLMSSFPKQNLSEFTWQEKFLDHFLLGLATEASTPYLIPNFLDCLLYCVVSLSSESMASNVMIRYITPLLDLFLLSWSSHPVEPILSSFIDICQRLDASERRQQLYEDLFAHLKVHINKVIHLSDEQLKQSVESSSLYSSEKKAVFPTIAAVRAKSVALICRLSTACTRQSLALKQVASTLANFYLQNIISEGQEEFDTQPQLLRQLLQTFDVSVLAGLETPDIYNDTILPWFAAWAGESDARDWSIFADIFSARLSSLASNTETISQAKSEWSDFLNQSSRTHTNDRVLLQLLQALTHLDIPISTWRNPILDHALVTCVHHSSWKNAKTRESDLISLLTLTVDGLYKESSWLNAEAIPEWLAGVTAHVTKLSQDAFVGLVKELTPIETIMKVTSSAIPRMIAQEYLRPNILKLVLELGKLALMHGDECGVSEFVKSRLVDNIATPILTDHNFRASSKMAKVLRCYGNMLSLLQENSPEMVCSIKSAWLGEFVVIMNHSATFSPSFGAIQILLWGQDWVEVLNSVCLDFNVWDGSLGTLKSSWKVNPREPFYRVISTLVHLIQPLTTPQLKTMLVHEWIYTHQFIASSLLDLAVSERNKEGSFVDPQVENIAHEYGAMIRDQLLPACFLSSGSTSPECALAWSVFSKLWAMSGVNEFGSQIGKAALSCFLSTAIDKELWTATQLDRICREFVNLDDLPNASSNKNRLLVFFVTLNQYDLQQPPVYSEIKKQFCKYFMETVLGSKDSALQEWVEIIVSIFRATDELQSSEMRLLSEVLFAVSRFSNLKVILKHQGILLGLSTMLATLASSMEKMDAGVLNSKFSNTVLTSLWSVIASDYKKIEFARTGCRLYLALSKLGSVERDYCPEFLAALISYSQYEPQVTVQAHDVIEKLCRLVLQGKHTLNGALVAQQVLPLLSAPYFIIQKSAAVLLREFMDTGFIEGPPKDLTRLLDLMPDQSTNGKLNILTSISLGTTLYYGILQKESLGFNIISEQTPFHKTLSFALSNIITSEASSLVWPYAWDMQIEDLEESDLSIQRLCAHNFYMALRVFPSSVRSWVLSSCDRATASKIEQITSQNISPRIIMASLAKVSSTDFKGGEDEMDVTVLAPAREIVAKYTKEDLSIEGRFSSFLTWDLVSCR
eukprot:TRINITY_DN2650_c0_g1_i2.p1 TRINITY_DN2650_c0_g1~~TRINITY_DN2650_c0_g1_i2.p1  ORF type:complete len:1492 (-),score=284.34 TRINITY_DN2650_c0_g1_i2:662-5137(-)